MQKTTSAYLCSDRVGVQAQVLLKMCYRGTHDLGSEMKARLYICHNYIGHNCEDYNDTGHKYTGRAPCDGASGQCDEGQAIYLP